MAGRRGIRFGLCIVLIGASTGISHGPATFRRQGDSAEAKTEKFKEELAQWRSDDGGKGRTKKPKYIFKSVDDLVAEVFVT